jgi:hypothetical protein
MGAKYSVSPSQRWRHAGPDDRPRLSAHITGRTLDEPGRWDERTPAGAVSPETAWADGVALPPETMAWFDPDDNQRPDRARAYAERVDGDVYGVIMPVFDRGDSTVATVLRIDHIDEPPIRAYLWAFLEVAFTEVFE